jgi:hypothetical protein
MKAILLSCYGTTIYIGNIGEVNIFKYVTKLGPKDREKYQLIS